MSCFPLLFVVKVLWYLSIVLPTPTLGAPQALSASAMLDILGRQSHVRSVSWESSRQLQDRMTVPTVKQENIVIQQGQQPNVLSSCHDCACRECESTDCICDIGFTGPDGGSCVECSPGKFKTAAGNTQCTSPTTTPTHSFEAFKSPRPMSPSPGPAPSPSQQGPTRQAHPVHGDGTPDNDDDTV